MNTIIYKIKNGEVIKGAIFNLFLNQGDFFLVDLKVYSDGELDCLGSITWEKLGEYLKSGKLTRSLPAKSRLFVPYIGEVITNSLVSPISSNERFLELVKDKIRKLSGEEDIKLICSFNFREWLINPSDENFEKLKTSYEKIPEGQRTFFEMNESKEPLVEIMNTNRKYLTKEQRENYLMDYFYGEWIELQ